MDPQTTAFVLDVGVYRMSAIKKAAYRFGGDFQVQIESEAPQVVRVTLTPRMGRTTTLAADGFLTEVLDQELREVVAEETAGLREVILAQAFSGLALTDEQGEHADFRDDPLEIEKTSLPRG